MLLGRRNLYLSANSLQALEVNLNPLWYGVLAEIGAGQVGYLTDLGNLISLHSPRWQFVIHGK